jgi:DNA-directed RNA polymerase specialized sigma24 family protein
VTKNLEKQCEQVLAGRITFTAFFRATHAEFTRMANYLLRRWVAPIFQSAEDIVQELYLGAHGAMFGDKPWDPSRGVSLTRYVVYNAMAYAKRKLHKARGAKLSGSADRNPSCFEIPFSLLGADATFADYFGDHLASDTPDPEHLIERAQEKRDSIARALAACETPRERIAIIALEEGGDVDGAGAVLYDDYPTRIALRLGSEQHAARYVARAAQSVAQRLDVATAS